jgi:hypothetical protein
MLADRYAPMRAWGGGEMADTADLKSASTQVEWGFESPPPYQSRPEITGDRDKQAKWRDGVADSASGYFDANFDANCNVLRELVC